MSAPHPEQVDRLSTGIKGSDILLGVVSWFLGFLLYAIIGGAVGLGRWSIATFGWHFAVAITLFIPVIFAVLIVRFARKRSLNTAAMPIAVLGFNILFLSASVFAISRYVGPIAIFSLLLGAGLLLLGFFLHRRGWLTASKKNSRPSGIVALVVFDVFFGIAGILSLPLMFAESARGATGWWVYWTVGTASSIPLNFVLALGLWRGRGWAWKWEAVLNILGFGIGIPYLIFGQIVYYGISMFFIIIVLLLLWSKAVRIHCGIIKQPEELEGRTERPIQ